MATKQKLLILQNSFQVDSKKILSKTFVTLLINLLRAFGKPLMAMFHYLSVTRARPETEVKQHVHSLDLKSDGTTSRK